jgi:hypothetical protein
MNKYRAISETEFIKLADVQITEAEYDVFKNGTQEERLALKDDLDLRFSNVTIEGSELDLLTTVYNSYKPELNDGDVYELISFDIAMAGGMEDDKMGAYNYKLNNQVINVILK